MWKTGCLVLLFAACGSVEALPSDSHPVYGDGECRLDTDCAGEHTVCADNGTQRACTCAAGFTTDPVSQACAWSGVVTDPGFADPSAWALTGGQAIDPTAMESGMRESGKGLRRLDLAALVVPNRKCPAHFQRGLPETRSMNG